MHSQACDGSSVPLYTSELCTPTFWWTSSAFDYTSVWYHAISISSFLFELYWICNTWVQCLTNATIIVRLWPHTADWCMFPCKMMLALWRESTETSTSKEWDNQKVDWAYCTHDKTQRLVFWMIYAVFEFLIQKQQTYLLQHELRCVWAEYAAWLALICIVDSNMSAENSTRHFSQRIIHMKYLQLAVAGLVLLLRRRCRGTLQLLLLILTQSSQSMGDT